MDLNIHLRISALDLLNQSLDVAWLGRLKICGQIEVVYRTLIAAKDGSPDQVSARSKHSPENAEACLRRKTKP